MSTPKVSVIVPVYNVEKYLDRCVMSLQNQTLKDIEIILVDDKSPDNCPALCDEYARQDSRIKVVHKKENEGLGMACNSGLEVATGEYIAFCDSDDYVDSNCYEVLLNNAIEYKADAVYSGIKRVDQNGLVTPMCQANRLAVFSQDSIPEFTLGMIASEPECKIERYRQMSAKIVLYLHETISNHHIQFLSEREYISEDLLFNLDFLGHAHLVVEIPNAFYYYFVNTQSLSQSFRKDRFEKDKIMREYILSRYECFLNKQELLMRADKMFIGYVRKDIEHIIKSNESKDIKRSLLSEICNDNIWDCLSKEYPIHNMPILKRMVFYFTKYKMINILWLLYKMRN